LGLDDSLIFLRGTNQDARKLEIGALRESGGCF
jgi:hypothetical protein